MLLLGRLLGGVGPVGGVAEHTLLVGVLLHLQLLPVQRLGLVLVVQHLLVHGLLVRHALRLSLAHVVD